MPTTIQRIGVQTLSESGLKLFYTSPLQNVELTKIETSTLTQIPELQQLPQIEQGQQIQQQQQQQLQQQQVQLQTIETLTMPEILPPVPTPSPPKTPQITDFGLRLPPPTILPFGKRKRKAPIKKVPTYSVFLRRRKKYAPIGTGLTKAQALKLGERKALGTLARTFKIRKTGEKEVFGIEEEVGLPQMPTFRGYQIRKGRKVALKDTFIQTNIANLQRASEKAELKEARRLSKLIGFKL